MKNQLAADDIALSKRYQELHETKYGTQKLELALSACVLAQKKLKPWLVIFGCICHSLALCSTAACEKFHQSFINFANEV